MLVNLVTVFVKSVRMGCNVAGLDDMTQTPNSQRVREERIQQRINARTERIDTELLHSLIRYYLSMAFHLTDIILIHNWIRYN